MTDRKPDFYVVKREGLDGAPEWFTFDADGHVWDYQLTLRHRFVTEADAAKIAKKYGGSVAPVCCTSKRAEPKMRERSSSWVLKRLAEGKVVVVVGNLENRRCPVWVYRFHIEDGAVEYRLLNGSGEWGRSAGFAGEGTVMCRIARPSEVPQ